MITIANITTITTITSCFSRSLSQLSLRTETSDGTHKMPEGIGITAIIGTDAETAKIACAAAPTVIVATVPPTTPRAQESGGALHMSDPQQCPTPEPCSALHWA